MLLANMQITPRYKEMLVSFLLFSGILAMVRLGLTEIFFKKDVIFHLHSMSQEKMIK